MMRLWHALFALAMLCSQPLVAGELVVLVDTSNEMPMAGFEHGQLIEGVHRDIGAALAQGLGRTPRFVAMPRKRIGRVLEEGGADLLCSYVPEWLPGPFDWSVPFIPLA